jgi:serine/threonine protein kinase
MAVEEVIRCPACNGEIEVSTIPPGAAIFCPYCQHQFNAYRIFGNYRLDKLLGEGGMGSVYEAVDINLNRPVAIKVLKATLSEDKKFAATFVREVEITAALSHPNIVQVFSFGEHNGQYYLVMELIGHYTLDNEITKRRRLSELEVVDIGIGVASGLEFALQRGGLIHRDIKPGNILFGKDRTPKVVDFGLALTPETAEESSGEIWGTPYYVSPERLEAIPEDFRSDMYSLGMTLYHSLAGRPAFEAQTAEMVASMHLTEHPLPIQTYAPNISEATSFAIMQCIARTADRRWQSYREFIEQLEDAKRRLLQAPATAKAIPKIQVVEEEDDSKRMIFVIAGGVILVVLGVAGFIMAKMFNTL